jgi:fatty acid desaturase
MDKAAYLDIRNQLDFSKPEWIIGLTLVFEAFFLWAIIWLLGQPGWVYYILSQILLALFFFHGFALMHECGHGNFSKNRKANALYGHFFSIFCFIPFFSWKYIHQQHHVGIGYLDKDPTLNGIRKIRERGEAPALLRISWQWWLPLFASTQLITMWLYPLRRWLKEKEFDKWCRDSAISVAFLGSIYLLLPLLFPELITVRNILPAFILHMVFQEFINLPHHLETPLVYSSPGKERLPLWEQHRVSRSCYCPVFVEVCTLNFDLHTEHHYFPSLPWYRLKKVRKLIRAKLGADYNEIDMGWLFRKRKTDILNVMKA